MIRENMPSTSKLRFMQGKERDRQTDGDSCMVNIHYTGAMVYQLFNGRVGSKSSFVPVAPRNCNNMVTTSITALIQTDSRK